MRSRSNFPSEFIDDLRLQNDIVEVMIDLGVPLKRAGKDHKSCCPFHTEKTPSFTVSTDRQLFYCFGCQTGGNLITFLTKRENMSFVEAIEFLANRVGVALPDQSPAERERYRKRKTLHDLNRFAIDFFKKELRSDRRRTAQNYLNSREFSPKMVQDFEIGYAPHGPKDLINSAISVGFSIQQLIDVGLAKTDDRGTIDKFRNRVIFPICDDRGNPIGFGGRVLSADAMPKYLNTPSTDLYDKSRTLYNLHRAKSAIQKDRIAILVEGYFDVIRLSQADLLNVVALCGTSLTEEHAKLLKRFTDEVVIIFDGDQAGVRATQRGLSLLLKADLRVRMATLADDQDPDSFVQKHGIDQFRDEIGKAINLIEFQIRQAVARDAIRRIDVKSSAVKEIAETLSMIKSAVEIDAYVDQTSRELEIDRAIIWRELKDFGVKPIRRESENRKDQMRSGGSKRVSVREKIERQLIQILLQFPEFISTAREFFNYQDLTNSEMAEIAKTLWEIETDQFDLQSLIENCDEKIRGVISRLAFERIELPNPSARFEGCLKKLNQLILLDLEKRIRSDALTSDDDGINALAELNALSERRRAFHLKFGLTIDE